MAEQQQRRTQIWPKKEDGRNETMQSAALRRLRARQRQRGTMMAAGISYEWHKATFDNDLTKLRTIRGWSENRWYEPDPRGMTLLHVAVLRGHVEAVSTLLDAGCPWRVRDARGWTPLDHAQVTGQRECAKLLIEREKKCCRVEDTKSCSGPDCRFQLRCDLRLRRRFLCSGTRRRRLNVTKVGSKIRIDHKSFSLILCSSDNKIVYYDRNENSAFSADLCREDDVDGVVDEQFRPAAAPVRRRLLFRYFYKARECCCCCCCCWWPNRNSKLRVAGYETSRYDAYFEVDPGGGHRLRSIGGHGPLDCTWVQYLGGYRADDDFCRKSFSLDQARKAGTTTAKSIVDELFLDNVHNLDVKCWFTHPSFPLKLWHLIPFLKKARRVDPSVAKVERFIEQYLVGDRIVSGRFPLRIQVPGSAGVRATAAVKTFKLLDKNDSERETTFDLPADCDHHTNCRLDSVLDRIRNSL